MSAGMTRDAAAMTRSLGTARGGAEPGQRRAERLARDEHHVVAEQEPAPQPGAEREQPQAQPDGRARQPAGPGRARGS